MTRDKTVVLIARRFHSLLVEKFSLEGWSRSLRVCIMGVLKS